MADLILSELALLHGLLLPHGGHIAGKLSFCLEEKSGGTSTAKMNDVDLKAWLADDLARIASHPAHRLDELLP